LKPWHNPWRKSFRNNNKTTQKTKTMTTSIQSLRTKSIRQAKLKLDQHRELGVQSPLNIFEVADLLDRIRFTEEKLSVEPQGFALILN
jgi:hypothetical protein